MSAAGCCSRPGLSAGQERGSRHSSPAFPVWVVQGARHLLCLTSSLEREDKAICHKVAAVSLTYLRYMSVWLAQFLSNFDLVVSTWKLGSFTVKPRCLAFLEDLVMLDLYFQLEMGLICPFGVLTL